VADAGKRWSHRLGEHVTAMRKPCTLGEMDAPVGDISCLPGYRLCAALAWFGDGDPDPSPWR
jgi:hypothetical protein